jgi:hypothetical protein
VGQLAGRASRAGLAAALSLAALVLAAAAGSVAAQSDEAVRRLTRELVPAVERAVGLEFRRAPLVAVRTRGQLRAYLDRRLAEQYPPAELRAVERAYKAFGLVHDSLDIGRLTLALLAEQVAGFYDPDSAALFVVRGSDPRMLRFILAHELVHALQDQYMPLNNILKARRQNDRQMAGQAVAEGQATLASLLALQPGLDLERLGSSWGAVRSQLRAAQEAMPVFAGAPRIIQEGLLFPYIAGADFMRAYELRRTRRGEMPWGDRLPVSTEQILHPSRYFAGERPVRVGIASTGDTVVYEDDLGEFETRIALETWGAGAADAVAAAAGWNGDRYRVLGTPRGTALVWAVAWDTAEDAAQFERLLRRLWERRRAAAGANRWQLDLLEASGVKVVRLVDAPAAWAGWRRLPGISAGR